MWNALIWIRFWSVAMGAFGLVLVLGVATPVAWPVDLFLDVAFWPVDGAPRIAAPDARLFGAVTGGLTAGFCTIVGLTLDRAIRVGDLSLVRTVTVGLLTWFVVDSAGSFAVGAWMNVFLNTLILAGFVIPISLWKPAA